MVRKYRGVDCGNCLKQKDCTKTKEGIRIVKMFPFEEERQALDEKMKTVEGKKIYSLRKQIVEPVFGDIRENNGVMSFITRGLQTVKTEFNRICSANNIRRSHLKGKSKTLVIGSVSVSMRYIIDMNFDYRTT